jgi:hypothetical protein
MYAINNVKSIVDVKIANRTYHIIATDDGIYQVLDDIQLIDKTVVQQLFIHRGILHYLYDGRIYQRTRIGWDVLQFIAGRDINSLYIIDVSRPLEEDVLCLTGKDGNWYIYQNGTWSTQLAKGILRYGPTSRSKVVIDRTKIYVYSDDVLQQELDGIDDAVLDINGTLTVLINGYTYRLNGKTLTPLKGKGIKLLVTTSSVWLITDTQCITT